MYIQKLYKNGNSLAVTIPKQAQKEQDLRDGTKVEVVSTPSGLLINKFGRKGRGAVKKDFLKLLHKVNEQYGDALKELARK